MDLDKVLSGRRAHTVPLSGGTVGFLGTGCGDRCLLPEAARRHLSRGSLPPASRSLPSARGHRAFQCEERGEQNSAGKGWVRTAGHCSRFSDGEAWAVPVVLSVVVFLKKTRLCVSCVLLGRLETDGDSWWPRTCCRGRGSVATPRGRPHPLLGRTPQVSQGAVPGRPPADRAALQTSVAVATRRLPPRRAGV